MFEGKVRFRYNPRLFERATPRVNAAMFSSTTSASFAGLLFIYWEDGGPNCKCSRRSCKKAQRKTARTSQEGQQSSSKLFKTIFHSVSRYFAHHIIGSSISQTSNIAQIMRAVVLHTSIHQCISIF